MRGKYRRTSVGRLDAVYVSPTPQTNLSARYDIVSERRAALRPRRPAEPRREISATKQVAWIKWQQRG